MSVGSLAVVRKGGPEEEPELRRGHLRGVCFQQPSLLRRRQCQPSHGAEQICGASQGIVFRNLPQAWQESFSQVRLAGAQQLASDGKFLGVLPRWQTSHKIVHAVRVFGHRRDTRGILAYARQAQKLFEEDVIAQTCRSVILRLAEDQATQLCRHFRVRGADSDGWLQQEQLALRCCFPRNQTAPFPRNVGGTASLQHAGRCKHLTTLSRK
mmetsp:Transcript_52747/g.140745  ORF Transcript_52747/g.140745 Transcript_52747/m.140745 type:complete len:211 (+) Transcript_52747:782-1414(+)